jgi:hypothetical protein
MGFSPYTRGSRLSRRCASVGQRRRDPKDAGQDPSNCRPCPAPGNWGRYAASQLPRNVARCPRAGRVHHNESSVLAAGATADSWWHGDAAPPFRVIFNMDQPQVHVYVVGQFEYPHTAWLRLTMTRGPLTGGCQAGICGGPGVCDSPGPPRPNGGQAQLIESLSKRCRQVGQYMTATLRRCDTGLSARRSTTPTTPAREAREAGGHSWENRC